MNVKDDKHMFKKDTIYTEPIWTFGEPLVEIKRTKLLDLF
jgi:hypothetical protein